jgi:hypothetical protein
MKSESKTDYIKNLRAMGDLSNFLKMEAICTYLRGYGYKARVADDNLTVQVKDPIGDTFIVLTSPTREAAIEFIKVRSQS